MWLFNFDRVVQNVNGNMEGRIWIKFGIKKKELVGVKGLEENWKVTSVSHASLFIR